VTDEHDVQIVRREALGLQVDLRDERAGGVDRLEGACLRLGVHRRGDTVGREDNRGTLRDLLGFLDEDGALRLERAHDVGVVHDLLADVDRRTVGLQRLLDGEHRTVDPRAVTAWFGDQHPPSGAGGRGSRRLRHALQPTSTTACDAELVRAR